MPLPVTFGSASAKGFGFTSASGGGKFGWLAKLTYVGGNGVNAMRPIILNKTSSGNYIVNLQYLNTGNNPFEYIVTFNDIGTAISNTSSYGNNSLRYYYEVFDSVLDSSNNIINVGRITRIEFLCCSCLTRYLPYAAITDASSTNIATKDLDGLGNSPNATRYVSLFSDSSLLLSGHIGSFVTILKRTSTLGTAVWGRKINSTADFAVSLNSSDVTIVLINYSQSTLIFLRFDSSGTLLKNSNGFDTYINGFNGYNGGSINPTKPVFDASNNFYFTGNNGSQVYVCCYPVNTYKIFIAAMNSTGSSNIFAKQLTAGSSFNSPTRVSRDSANNYFAANYSGSQGSGVAIFKVNDSGSVQWARLLTASSGSLSVSIESSLVINGSDYLMSFGVNPYDTFVMKMPNDGSGFGTSFSLGGRSFTYSILTDFTVSNLTITFQNNNSTTVTNPSNSVNNSTNTLTASTDISITNKKI